ncbi:MAG: NnrU family protein, partial [Burkholderiaceae bacterium]
MRRSQSKRQGDGRRTKSTHATPTYGLPTRTRHPHPACSPNVSDRSATRQAVVSSPGLSCKAEQNCLLHSDWISREIQSTSMPSYRSTSSFDGLQQDRGHTHMLLLAVGVILFLGIHLVPTSPDVRSGLIARFGAPAYKVAFAIASFAGLAVIVLGYHKL